MKFLLAGLVILQVGVVQGTLLRNGNMSSNYYANAGNNNAIFSAVDQGWTVKSSANLDFNTHPGKITWDGPTLTLLQDALAQVNTIGAVTGSTLVLEFDWTPAAGASAANRSLEYQVVAWTTNSTPAASDIMMNNINSESKKVTAVGGGTVYDLLNDGASSSAAPTFSFGTFNGIAGSNLSASIAIDLSNDSITNVNEYHFIGVRFHIAGDQSDLTAVGSTLDNVQLSVSNIVVEPPPPTPPTTANGKNLIWIITDEHNLRTLGCYRDTMTQQMAEMWGDGFVVETPVLDTMADNGALFTRMHCSVAVCTPSRAAMFTGRYPLSLGIPNNSNMVGDGKYLHADVTTIFDVLKDAGYLTGYAGKWHISEGGKAFEDAPGGKWWEPYPEDDTNDTYGIIVNKFMFNGGHDKWYGLVEGGVPATANGLATPTVNGDPYLVTGTPTLDHYKTESGEIFNGAVHNEAADGKLPFYSDGITTNVRFQTDFLTDRAKEFIQDFTNGTYNVDNPGVSNDITYSSFFYVLSIPDPHTADSVREPYASMYTNHAFELPRTWLNPNYEPTAYPTNDYADNPSWMKADGKAADLYDPLDPGSYTIQDRVAQYFGMVKCIDDNVGRLITHLENTGVLHDTILLFSSDHGDLFGEHRRVNKGTPQDMSMRIPFILVDGSQLLTSVTNNSPLIPNGIQVEESANNTDWVETFLSLLEVNNIPDTHGRDITPLIAADPPADWHEPTVQSQGWLASTDSRYKLVVDASSSRATWLMDMERDPREYTNFVDYAEYDGVVRKLAQGIKDYMTAHPEDHDTDQVNEYNRLLAGWTRYAEVYGLNPDESGDEDGDGLLDIHEYTFGTDPLDPNNTNGAQVIEVTASNGWATLYHQIRDPEDAAYVSSVEWSTNLVTGPWNSNWDTITTNYPVYPGFNTLERTVERNEDTLYFRLKTEAP